MKHPQKFSEEIINQNPWWTCKKDIFVYPDGKKGEYFYGEDNNSVMAVPVLDDGRIVLISQYRYLREKLSIEFPCGSIDASETVQQAVQRELIEETGYKAEEFIKIGIYDGLSGVFKDTTHVFIAEGLEQVGQPQPEEMSELEVLLRRPDEVDEMVRKNEIWDGQTLAAWALIHHHFLHKE